MKRKSGFTLIELVVTISILGILSSLLMPVYGLMKERTKSAVCTANRNTLVRTIVILQAADDTKSIQQLYDDAMAGSTFTCPDGGNFNLIVNDDGFFISCDKHDSVAEDTRSDLEKLGDYNPLDDPLMGTGGLPGFITNLKNENPTLKFTNIDSTSTNGGSVILMRSTFQEATGKDFDEYLASNGIQSWAYRAYTNGITKLYWSTVDFSTLDTSGGKKYIVPCIAYNMKTGTYNVWNCQVASSTSNGETYNIITSEGKLGSQSSNAADQTYENAIKWLADSLAQAGYTS